MARRYVAIVGAHGVPLRDKARCAIAKVMQLPGFNRVIISNELIVLADQDDLCVKLSGGAGVVLGTAFTKGDLPRRLSACSEKTTKAIRASAGTYLVDHYWGGYVAVVRDADAFNVHVLRDPSGMLPCYYCEMDGLTIIASDIESLVACTLLSPEIDWTYVAHHLAADHMRFSRTGLVGLTELLAGFRLTVKGEALQLSQIWSPWQFTEPDHRIGDAAIATARVRATARACVNAWATCFDHVLLNLSGGLDSSIVAACLAHEEMPFTALTFVTHDPSGDERSYARIVAEAVGVTLHEELRDFTRIEVERSGAAHLPRPVARAFAQESDRISNAAAARAGAGALFNGGGGDNIFCFLQSVAPIIDAVRAHGFGRRAWHTLNDICVLTGASLWQAARLIMRTTVRRSPGHGARLNTMFLTHEATARAASIVLHPWLDRPVQTLPGAAAHTGLLMNIQNHLGEIQPASAIPAISPLASQPLMELCLQIPSWMWSSRGYNRAIARRAFAEDLPPSITWRRSKGTPDSFVIEILEANRSKIRGFLCDGLLAREGLIDQTAIAEAIGDPRPAGALPYWRIMALVDVEAWARSWASRMVRGPVMDATFSGRPLPGPEYPSGGIVRL